MREAFLKYCLPDITDAEIEEVVATLRSGWLAKGPRTLAFEQQFADYVGAKYAVGVNSCTAALHLALLAQGIGPGDEVITTPMTFAASANTILHVGAKVVFVDIDQTGCIDPNHIEAAITPRTKAIVPVHYSGQACALDEIYALADKHGLFVSEDAAHALDTLYRGRRIGTQLRGTASYSFYVTKNLCTGEGGMLATDDEQIADRARVLSSHGMSKNAWNRYSKGGDWRYDIEEPGYKYNMFDLQAALGMVQLSRMQDMQERRIALAQVYNRELSKIPGIRIPLQLPHTQHNWHLYVIHIDAAAYGYTRDELIPLLSERNIGTSVHFLPVHLMSAYRKLGHTEGQFPVTEQWSDTALSLPLYPTMTNEDVQDVIGALRELARC